ncbi:MAG: hypothetical protein M1832_004047 [Thelocarpon impressellum]|nr:MAG: hypothetical protein M1832_004047 [Thelocarpon impressellum]
MTATLASFPTFPGAQPEGERRDIPIILDESYGSPETASLHYGAQFGGGGGGGGGDEGRPDGLLVGAVLSLSMSEHGKAFQSNDQGFPSAAPYQDETYLYAQPAFASSPQFPHPAVRSLQDSGEEEAAPAQTGVDHAACRPRLAEAATASAAYTAQQHQPDPHSAQHERPLQFVDIGGTRPGPPPDVQSYCPRRGQEGTKVFVYICSTYDLLATTSPGSGNGNGISTFILLFGTGPSPAAISRLEAQDPYFQYLLTADAPAFASTGWVDPGVALYLRMEDEGGQNLGTVEVGDFTYTTASSSSGTGQQLVYASPQTTANTRKRRGSDDLDSSRSPAKRALHQRPPQHMHSTSRDDIPAFSYTPARGSPYAPYLQHTGLPGDGTTTYRRYSHERAGYQPDGSPRQQAYPFSHSPTLSSHPTLRAPSPQTPSWSPSFASMSTQASRSPRLSATSASTRSTVPTVPSPSGAANPPLIRTSTLQHSPSPGSTPAGAMHPAQAFNPYAMYPHKAVLDIQGDLDSMADDWTEPESVARRRLVQFRRRQSGNTIHTSFKPVAQDERPPQSICISCIWWQEKQECYVTSVDTIYLLEALVAVRFTVEEKNRIRRNLEGFRPLTVSKAKADSEEFFKVIMGFPNPKPRNIEKDVKVFPWKILAHALKKIIGKYSASYSSTAGALPSSVGSSGYEGVLSTSGGLAGLGYGEESPEPDRSPPSMPDLLNSAAYAGGMAGTARSVALQQHEQMSRAAAPDLRLAVPQLPQPTLPSSRWPQHQQLLQHQHPLQHPLQHQQPQHQQHHYSMDPAQHQHLGGQATRRTWDMSAYLDPHPGSMPAEETPTIYYQQQRNPAASGGGEGDPGSMQIRHPTSRV